MNDFLKAKIGFGTYLVENQEELNNSIRVATLAKYDFIDTAWFYKNEVQIGNAYAKFKKEYPDVPTLPLQTKIWPTFFDQDMVVEVKKSLKNLGDLKIIDAILLHRPHVDNSINVKGWKGLIECQKLGLVKYIGVSNFEPDMIRILFNETGVMPQIVQDEASVNSLRNDRIRFANDKGIMLQGWRPLGLIKKNLNDPLLIKLAKKYNCQITQLLIAFSISKGYVPLVKSTITKRIEDNIQALNIKLEKQDVVNLELSLNEHQSTIPGGSDSYAYLSILKKK